MGMCHPNLGIPSHLTRHMEDPKTCVYIYMFYIIYFFICIHIYIYINYIYTCITVVYLYLINQFHISNKPPSYLLEVRQKTHQNALRGQSSWIGSGDLEVLGCARKLVNG